MLWSILVVFDREYQLNREYSRQVIGQSGRGKPSTVCRCVHYWAAIVHLDARGAFFHDGYTRHGAAKGLKELIGITSRIIHIC